VKKTLLQKILSVALMLVFFYSTTPRDFLHLLADHKDTMDLVYNGTAQLSGQHIHCGFLHIDIAPFLAAGNTVFTYSDTFFRELRYTISVIHPITVFHFFSLRAPPSL
jgi:hypothetical protein